MARQYAKSAGVRRAILEACSEAFGEAGFHGASMAEIARRAGISHTGLLHHFPRKEDLLMGVLSLQDELAAQFLRENGALDGDPATMLRGMLRTLVIRDRRPGLAELSAVLMGEATVRDHPAHAFFAERYENIRSFLTRIYADLAARGRVRSILRPDQLAAATIALVEGAHRQWLFTDHDAFDAEGFVQDVLATFVIDLALPEGDATCDSPQAAAASRSFAPDQALHHAPRDADS